MVGDANHTCEMTEAEAIQIMRKHIEGQFPKECPNCHHRYATLREYILATRPVGAKSYDADAGELRQNYCYPGRGGSRWKMIRCARSRVTVGRNG